MTELLLRTYGSPTATNLAPTQSTSAPLGGLNQISSIPSPAAAVQPAKLISFAAPEVSTTPLAGSNNPITYKKVPDIPAHSFKDDVDELFLAWYEPRIVVMDNRRVAIKDWPTLFKGTSAWRHFKSTFGNWKVGR
jgi:hypothetical protein